MEFDKIILFLTATRADFGKLKSLIRVVIEKHQNFKAIIAVTGMHLSELHGSTIKEVRAAFPDVEIRAFLNSGPDESMDLHLANTISGLHTVIQECEPDLFVIHGDRVEALAGAISGSLNNVLVAHIEGGEVSGTIDELMRHATSKMSHIHFVANEGAKALLQQMGEDGQNIFVIGSPDLDLMQPDKIIPINEAKNRYQIPFKEFAIVLLHPVTTDLSETQNSAESILNYVKENSKTNFIVCGPNNDYGSGIIWKEWTKFNQLSNVRIFPSIRFEFFVSLLKEAQYILGNSSAGIREAPYLGTPCVNVGSRQNSRASGALIIDVPEPSLQLLTRAVDEAVSRPRTRLALFGDGKSDVRFSEFLSEFSVEKFKLQKKFVSRQIEGSFD